MINHLNRIKAVPDMAELDILRHLPKDDLSSRELWQLALNAYRMGYDIGPIKAALALSAHESSLGWAQAPMPVKGNERSAYDFGLSLGVCAAWGTLEDRRRLAGVPMAIWFYPQDPYYQPPADANELFQAHLRGELTHTLAQTYLAFVQAENAGRDVVELEGPWIRGCLAILDGDVATWNACLQSMVTYQRFAARYNYLMLSSAGLMCLQAMGLAKLGLEAGFTCTVTSPYLPLHVL